MRRGSRRDVNVTVTRVVHFRKFDPAATKPAQLEYLLFGKGTELFLAHLDHLAAGLRSGPLGHVSRPQVHRR